MELTTHQKTVKYTVYCLVIAVAGLLQNTPGLFWQIGSARCFLLLPVTLLLVMGERELPAALLGLFAGCVWDQSSEPTTSPRCARSSSAATRASWPRDRSCPTW